MGLDQTSTKRFIDLETVTYKGFIDIAADYYVDSNIDLTANNFMQFLIAETELNGVVLSANDGLKFLLAKQTNKAENGIYQVLSLNPTLIFRSLNFRAYSQIQGKTPESVVRIQVLKEGVPNYQGTFYNSSTTEPFVIGTTPIEITATTPSKFLPDRLDEQNDVNILSPIDGDFLVYNSLTGKWENTQIEINGGTY
jgi:hypothetical protein